MNLEGELLIRVHSDAGRVARAELSSTRLHLASRVLHGRTPTEAVGAVSRLYSICGKAQGVAAAMACDAAMGRAPDEERIDAHRRRVGAESASEGLWRALIDWPEMLGGAPQTRAFKEARNAIDAVTNAASGEARAAVADVLAREVFGVPVSRWNELATPGELASWAASSHTAAAALITDIGQRNARFGASAVGLMPAMTGDMIEHDLAPVISGDPAYARMPRWQGAVGEPGSLARMRAHPLVAAVVERFGRSALARIAARLAELCAFAGGALPAIGSRPLGDERGIAWVETSRGLLVHQVALEGDRIRDYRIVAPTEWNFHPEGALVRGIEGASFDDESSLRRGVKLLVQTLDPCVAWNLELDHA